MAEHNHEHEHHHHFEMPQKSRMEEALSKYNLNITDEEVKEAVKDIIANNNGQVTWSINVDGADSEYCSTGIHIYYDDRLELALDAFRYALRARGRDKAFQIEDSLRLEQL